MVVVSRLGVKYSVDNNLYREIMKFNADKMKETDSYRIFLVCGLGGSGKSAFANQMCALLDRKFNIGSIGFTTNQFKGVLLSKINHAVSFDEAYRGISGRNSLGRDQKQLLRMFYEIRQFNQVIFLCTNSFFRLDEAYAVEISDGMFLIYKNKRKGGRIERCFKYFNRKKKAKLFYLSKKVGKNYNLVKTNFKGKVTTNTYVVSDEIYRKKKLDSISEPDEITGDELKDDRYKKISGVLSEKLAKSFDFGYTKQEHLLTQHKIKIDESFLGKIARRTPQIENSS